MKKKLGWMILSLFLLMATGLRAQKIDLTKQAKPGPQGQCLQGNSPTDNQWGSCSPTLYYQTIEQNGTDQTQREKLNLTPGSNTTVTCTDNSGNGSTDCQVNASTSGQTLSGTYLASGGGVFYTGTNFDYTVSAAQYVIAGTAYTSPQTNITLAVADPTYNRFDTIYVDTAGTVHVITGTAGANPVIPEVSDPSTQLALTSVEVFANTTTPPGVTNENLYLDDAEWVCTTSGSSINCASTTDPYSGTKDIELTNAAKGDWVNLAKGSQLTLSDYSNLVFQIRSKAQWASQRSLTLTFSNSGATAGSSVTFKNGSFGFDSGQTTSYQQIVIPVSSFATGSGSVDSLKITVSGGGNSTISAYIDSIILQSGTVVSQQPSGTTVEVDELPLVSSTADLSDATPPAQTGYLNIKWQKDGLSPTHISGEVPVTGNASKVVSASSISGTGVACGDGSGNLTNSGCGGSVDVNGSPVSNPNFNDSTPAAPAGNTNVTFQVSGSNVSGYVPSGGGGGGTSLLSILQNGHAFTPPTTSTWPTQLGFTAGTHLVNLNSGNGVIFYCTDTSGGDSNRVALAPVPAGTTWTVTVYVIYQAYGFGTGFIAGLALENAGQSKLINYALNGFNQYAGIELGSWIYNSGSGDSYSGNAPLQGSITGAEKGIYLQIQNDGTNLIYKAGASLDFMHTWRSVGNTVDLGSVPAYWGLDINPIAIQGDLYVLHYSATSP